VAIRGMLNAVKILEKKAILLIFESLNRNKININYEN